jgi:hypothetical protein
MEHTPSSEADSRLVGQECTRILWNSNIHYRLHKIRQLDPVILALCFKLRVTVTLLSTNSWPTYVFQIVASFEVSV